jgi:hypothetical protein
MHLAGMLAMPLARKCILLTTSSKQYAHPNKAQRTLNRTVLVQVNLMLLVAIGIWMGFQLIFFYEVRCAKLFRSRVSARQPSFFSLLVQRKETKRKDTPCRLYPALRRL